MRRKLLGALLRRADDVPVEDFRGSALVFAPHFDDEVLGCGGTIARLADAGVDVHVWFFTDGAKSHSHMMPGDELAAMRESESYRAARVLGVPDSNVRTHGFPDSLLSASIDAAVASTIDDFKRLAPSLVFAPYRHDGPDDHEACNVICRDLVRQAGLDVTLLEYPVWAWFEWPWTEIELGGRSRIPAHTVASIRNNLKWFRHFRRKVDVASYLPRKKEALQEYRSQMTRVIPDDRWKTLSDVGSGSWLENCLMPYEVFSIV